MSLLKYLEKLLEKLFFTQLQKFIQKWGRFDPIQAGFLSGHFIEYVVLSVLNYLHRLVDDGGVGP